MKLLAGLGVALLIWASGLLAFAARVERSTPPGDPPDSDAVVVLTGGSAGRITAALQLLEAGKAKRMLISGVNRQVTRGQLQILTGADKPIFDCCVDLGFVAANTAGNARETADWARGKGYKTLILVTADYHMPRARLELKAAMPEAIVTPYPVETPELRASRWWATTESAERMAAEYSKYLVVLGRETLSGFGAERATASSGGAKS
ncbi:MAG TPA: YdcF family protein [Caulobacteraceae bacterium]|nr:YdcF family protein [Caulobacteraceae bacterium]